MPGMVLALHSSEKVAQRPVVTMRLPGAHVVVLERKPLSAAAWAGNEAPVRMGLGKASPARASTSSLVNPLHSGRKCTFLLSSVQRPSVVPGAECGEDCLSCKFFWPLTCVCTCKCVCVCARTCMCRGGAHPAHPVG